VHVVFLGVHTSVFMALRAWVGGNAVRCVGKDQPLRKKSHLQIRALPALILVVRCMHLPIFTVTIYFSNVYIPFWCDWTSCTPRTLCIV